MDNGNAIFRKDHDQLMSEAREISNVARAALWRALVTARQIENLVRPRGRNIKRALGNDNVRWIRQDK